MTISATTCRRGSITMMRTTFSSCTRSTTRAAVLPVTTIPSTKSSLLGPVRLIIRSAYCRHHHHRPSASLSSLSSSMTPKHTINIMASSTSKGIKRRLFSSYYRSSYGSGMSGSDVVWGIMGLNFAVGTIVEGGGPFAALLLSVYYHTTTHPITFHGPIP